MHNSYFVLKQVSARLADEIAGCTLTSCFSQEKEVLVTGFTGNYRSFFIVADLNASFSCLSFPGQFHRARRNSVDLFHEAIGGNVTEVRQFENERSFLIQLDNTFGLLFKMHGNKSNVLLTRHGKPVQLFRTGLTKDLRLDISTLDRTSDFSREGFMACESPRARYVTLGAPVWEHLESKGWSTLTREQQWLLFYDELKELDSGKYFIHHGPTPLFSLHKQGAAQSLGGDVLTALTVFYRTAVTQRALESMRKTALTSIDRRLKTMRASLDEVEKRKKELGSVDTDARWADLIMAHLHAIPKGAQSVSLPDFDGASTVEIPLVKSLDPQRNAERYYRKSKNRKLERGRVEELILSKTQGLIRLAEQRDRVLKAQSAGELSAETDPGTGRKKAEGKPLPYMELDFKGYKILIGRNAASNDTLTTKVAAPNDEWLHARDCPGSHVVVRAVKGKVTPREVMARAAELAGWHSKRRHETLCPVIVTKRKYVRKRKGSAPGEVVVEREKVIFVTPRG